MDAPASERSSRQATREAPLLAMLSSSRTGRPLDEFGVEDVDGLSVQGAGAGAAEEDSADGGVALQAAGGVHAAPLGGEPPGQFPQRGVHRVGRVGGDDGDGDAVGQQRVQALEQKLVRPAAIFAQRVDDAGPLHAGLHLPRVGVTGIVARLRLAQQPARRARLRLGVEGAERDDLARPARTAARPPRRLCLRCPCYGGGTFSVTACVA